MRKLATELEKPERHWMPVLGGRLVLGTAAILALVIAVPFVADIGGRSKSAAVMLLAQSVQAMSGLNSVHMTARMRTAPNDNFEGIGLTYDFVPVEIWKQFGDMPRWRVEKPGRVVVMDGASTTLFIKPNMAARGSTRTGMVQWLMPLLDADNVLQSELEAARKKEAQAVLATDAGGRTLLTVTRKAQGDLTNDYARNKTLFEADHTRVYSFDTATKRLNSLQIFVPDNGKDVLVFEITEIRYNEPLDARLFSLELPQNVNWLLSPDKMTASVRPLPATARDAAVAFFEGASQQDWDRVLAVIPFSTLPDWIKKGYGGLQIVSIGEPFRSGAYPGWFVPYEVRMPEGTVKKHNLAVRNDNRSRRFVLDGGF